MTMRIKTAFASLAVATLFTMGASSQASAFDLLEELLGGKYGATYADSCGCSQKSDGHVQRCGSDCGEGLSGHAQRSTSKGGHGKFVGGHAQRSGFGHVQHSNGGKGGSCGGHAQRGCGDVKGGSKGSHVQHGIKGGFGHAQRGDVKGGKKGGSSKKGSHGDFLAAIRCKMSSMKGKTSSKGCDCSCDHDMGDMKSFGGFDFDGKSPVYNNGNPTIVPAPVIREEVQSVPLPGDPDPST